MTGRLLRGENRGLAAVLLTGWIAAGCLSSTPPAAEPPERVLGRDERLMVVRAAPGDSARSLASEFLGDPSLSWRILDANPTGTIRPGRAVLVPLQDWNPQGIEADGYQTVPILAYHRVGNRPAAMTITPQMLRRQFRYLQEHDYRVIPLADLLGFLNGRKQLPRRAVVLSFDDGHSSVYHAAYPILREFAYPATLFLYSDYVGRGGVTREQLREMQDSGLISLQPHSKTHDNLALRLPGEAAADYRKRLERETRVPRELLEELAPEPMSAFAYPFGDTNPELIAVLERQGYAMAVSVLPGANTAFTPRWLLRRSMIFGNRDMQSFIDTLQVFHRL